MPSIDDIIAKLTVREAQACALLLEYKSNREIADEMGISEQAVKNYFYNIFQKLGCRNRRELFTKLTTLDKLN